MAGKIKQMIDSIIEQKSGGDNLLASTVRARLLLIGINPDKYTLTSEDDLKTIEKLKDFAKQMGLKV